MNRENTGKRTEMHSGRRTAAQHTAPAAQARTHKKKRKNNRSLYYILLVVLLAIFVFCAIKIITYQRQQHASEKQQGAIIDEFVTPINSGEGETDVDDPEVNTGTGEPQPEQIHVNFDKLLEKYPDVVGYIYGANTGISYPIVQGNDNDFYLKHDYDGNATPNGSIFMEYQCSKDFSDKNSIVYGHHMKSGLMFAALEKYKNQSFYDAHPYFYLYTPTQSYRLELFAGCVVEGTSAIFDRAPSDETISSLVLNSTFRSKIGTPTGNIVTLSTCDYTFNDARYVVLGQLVPLTAPTEDVAE